MVTKPLYLRLKSFVFKYSEKWFDLSHYHGRVCFVSAPSSGRTTICASGCSQRKNTRKTFFSFFAEPPWTEKRGFISRYGLTRKSVRELSTSAVSLQYSLNPEVPKPEGRKLFFDTHAVVRLFEDNGFTTQQAEVMVQVLVKMTNSNMDAIYGDMVTKVQQEIMLQRVMSQIAAVKKDMIILEKSEFSTLLAENEKLKIQLLQLKVQLADIMNKVRSDSLLDMNLEKSRVKELKAEHEKKLLETRTEIMEMTAEHDRHITQTNMRIDTEVAGLKTMLESHKLDTIKYLADISFAPKTYLVDLDMFRRMLPRHRNSSDTSEEGGSIRRNMSRSTSNVLLKTPLK